MDMAARWLDFQHETPSFSVDLFSNRINTILDAPLPRCLRAGEKDTGFSYSIAEIDGNTPRPAKMGGAGVSRIGPTVAPSRPREKPVHESLLERGRMSKVAKETLCERAIEEEMKYVRPTPIVSEAAKSIPPRKERIEDRLLRKAQEVKEMREYDVRKLKMDEQKELERVAPFKPTISRRGRLATPRAYAAPHETNGDWYRRREQRLETARMEKLMKEINEVQNGPIINPRSERLAARWREKEGLTGLGNIEAMLERDRIAKMQRWEKYEAQANADANPTITLYAATLNRDGNVAERLYAEGKDMVRRREEMRTAALKESGAVPFTPRISSRAQSNIPRHRSVEDELLQKHQQHTRMMEEQRTREMAREKESHHPAINPVSDAIASALSNTAKERLYGAASRTAANRSHIESIEKENLSSDFLGGNTVHNRARRGSTSSVVSANMKDNLRSYEERRKEKLRQLHEEVAIKEEEECTFVPMTNRAPRVPPKGDIAERSSQWLARKQGKLEDLRRQFDQERESRDQLSALQATDLRAGSAANSAMHGRGRSASSADDSDEVDEQPRQRSRQRSLSVYGGDGTPWGVQDYLERQETARQRKREQEAKLNGRSSVSRQAWSQQPTKPREFSLGRKENLTPIRSLQRPPQVPLTSPLPESNQPWDSQREPSPVIDISGNYYSSLRPPSLQNYDYFGQIRP